MARRRHYRELLKRFKRVGAVRLLGMKVGRLSPGRATLTLETRPQHSHAQGIHGGVLAALADTALAMALFTRLPAGAWISTVEMKINYLTSHQRGRLRARARVLRQGKRLAVGEVEIRNAARELVAKSLLTYSIARRKKKARQEKYSPGGPREGPVSRARGWRARARARRAGCRWSRPRPCRDT